MVQIVSKIKGRELTVLFAVCAAALCGSLHAAESQGWFDGGIGDDWPRDASMFCGEWCEDAEAKAHMSGGALQIATDEDDPLVFKADDPKPLGTDDAATNVTISFTCAFRPFSRSVFPDVPDDAKGAVILVTKTEDEDPDEASEGEFYYAAYDLNSDTNVWKSSGLTAATNDFVDVTMLISHDDSDFINVQYTIKVGESCVTDTVPFKQSDASVHDVAYTGVGQASELKSTFKKVDPYRIGETEYADFEALKAAMRDGDTVVMQLNDTLSIGSTLTNRVTFVVGGYKLSGHLTNAADAEFEANTTNNLPLTVFIRADRTLTLTLELPVETVPGTLSGEDYARVFIGEDEWVRYGGVWRTADRVTMNFYYPGYFDRVAVTLHGSWGGRIADEQLNAFTNSVNTDEYVQDFYWDADTEKMIDGVFWFNDKWSDKDGREVAFPTRYASGDFYPNSTAILFRISYDMGEAGSSAVNDPKNPTGYSIKTRSFDLGDADASTAGLDFVRWEDLNGNEVTKIDAVELGCNNDGMLEDLTLYAVWDSEATTSKKVKTMAVVPGEQVVYYDTAEAAQSAAAAINDDKADGVLAPTGFTGDGAAYAVNFAATAEGTAISVVLTDDAAAKIAERLNDDVVVAAELADPTLTTVTVNNAEPGFYYSVVGGTTLDAITTEGARKLAQESSVELEKPALGTTGSAFYRIKVTLDRERETGKEDQWRN